MVVEVLVLACRWNPSWYSGGLELLLMRSSFCLIEMERRALLGRRCGLCAMPSSGVLKICGQGV